MKTLTEILNKINELPSEEDRVKSLAVMPSPYPKSLQILLKHAFDPKIKHRDIFGGDFDYVKCRDDNPGALLYEARKMYLFVEGNAPNLTDAKLKKVFENVLSTLIPADAEFLISVMRKKFPYPNISAKVVKRAFPGIF